MKLTAVTLYHVPAASGMAHYAERSTFAKWELQF